MKESRIVISKIVGPFSIAVGIICIALGIILTTKSENEIGRILIIAGIVALIASIGLQIWQLSKGRKMKAIVAFLIITLLALGLGYLVGRQLINVAR